MNSRVISVASRQVKPVFSLNDIEAKRRVRNLYKAWYRQLPHIVLTYNIPITVEMCNMKLREKFMENAHVKDLRTIDLLVVKGQMELIESVRVWKQRHHIMMYFKEGNKPKVTGFLNQFYEGH